MATPKRWVTRAREELVWEQATKGKTLKAIAAEVEKAGLGTMSFQAVSLMLHKLEDQVLAALQSRVAAHKAMQTAQLNYIYAEAFAEWERSKLPSEEVRVKTTVIKSSGGEEKIELPADEVTRTTRTRIGDPSLLGKALDALAAIRKIWGLDAVPEDTHASYQVSAIDPAVAKAALMAANEAEKPVRPAGHLKLIGGSN